MWECCGVWDMMVWLLLCGGFFIGGLIWGLNWVDCLGGLCNWSFCWWGWLFGCLGLVLLRYLGGFW